jgi:hypothetical protein
MHLVQNAFFNHSSFHVITYESLLETIGKMKAKSKGDVLTARNKILLKHGALSPSEL